jgi:hypothetical protein
MPVRYSTVTHLTEQVVGPQVFNNLVGFSVETMPTEAYLDVRDAMDTLYWRLINDIDWARILLEASARHSNLIADGTHPPTGRRMVDRVMADTARHDSAPCPTCLREALLAEDRYASPTEPGSPPDPLVDWPPVVATTVTYRRKGADR